MPYQCYYEGRFIEPVTEDGCSAGQISWTDFTLLTEASVKGEIKVKYIGNEAVK